MKLLGITGGVGMGKSTTGGFLEKRGMATLDTDSIARKLVEPDQPALAEIGRLFGASVLLPDGRLNRKELARRIFADAAERAKLEAILHPKIRQVWEADVTTWRTSGLNIGAVIIPLLFETKAEALFDSVICVACSAASQIERLQERGWSRTESKQRLEAQWPTEEKIARSDFVIWTDGTLEAHAAQVDRMLQRCQRSAPAGP